MMKLKLIFVAMLLAGLMLAGCSNTSTVQAPKPVSNSEQGETETESVAGTTSERNAQFEAAVADYNEIYKKALFSTGQGKEAEAQASTSQSLQAWEDIVAHYGQTPPPGYGETEAWSEVMNNLLSLEQEAVELVEAGQYQEAHQSLEDVRKILRKVRLENDITDNISDLMLTFHDEMEIVAELDNKEEAAPHIDNLVEYIQPLKEYSDAPDYAAMVDKLDQIVLQLQNAETEEAFKEAQSRIKPTFIQLYLKHG